MKLLLLALLGIFTPLSGTGVTTTWGANGTYQVTGLPSVAVAQASNYGGLVITTTGRVYSWTHTTRAPVASQVVGPKNVISVGEGFDFGVAVTSSGNLWGWGNNTTGNLCNGGTSSNAPVQRSKGVKGISAASGGAGHLELLTTSGSVLGCGGDRYGQLGNGSFSGNARTPVAVIGLPRKVVAISAGSQDSLALDSAGVVWAWGANQWGQLGNGDTSPSSVPLQVPLPASAVQVFAGGNSIKDGTEIALLSNGEVWSWGYDGDGQLGDGGSGYSDVPVQVQGLTGTITAVATDAVTSYAMNSSGNVWAWGKVNGSVTYTPVELTGTYSSISAVSGTFVGMNS